VSVLGFDVMTQPRDVRAVLGVVPQGLAIYEELTVAQNLSVFGGLHGLRGEALKARVRWGLDLSQLGDARDKRVSGLSGGMKRRLNIAAALLHDPKVLVFDEPTTGVDPQSRAHIFDTIRTLHREGRTVVYTTHYMEEVEALCDSVAIVDHGVLVAHDTLPALLASAQPTAFRIPAGPGTRERLAAAGFADPEGEGRSLEQVFLDRTGHALRDRE
jgi:ABC-2 type transport system ATP-binding protein